DIRLVVEKGSTRVRTLRLRGVQTVIGRQHGCNVRIPAADVSRRHCVLRIEDGYLSAEDLGSANGTFVNGQRISGRVFVRPGDHVGIGPVRFVVEYELSPAAVERLRQPSGGRAGTTESTQDLPVPEAFDWKAVSQPVDVLPVADDKDAPLTVEPI